MSELNPTTAREDSDHGAKTSVHGWDVIVVGGGPAGLSAALVLGRACRRVLLMDSGHPRNVVSAAMHGFLSRDGMPPSEFLQICRDQLSPYANVEMAHDEVTECRRDEAGFTIKTASGREEYAPFLLLATGIKDRLPEIEGFHQFYGHSAHHCPYCDGWEHRGRRIAVYGRGGAGVEMAIELTGWSKEVTLCTDGDKRLTTEQRERLRGRGIGLIETEVSRLTGSERSLRAIHFLNGQVYECAALFFVTSQKQSADLATSLGCELDEEQCIGVDARQQSAVKGLFIAGNASRGPNMVVLAAAEGAHAALSINECLLRFDE